MVKQSKRRQKPRVRIGFPAYAVFPPSDILASYLLSLMCGYNDIVRFSDWMEAHRQVPKDELARKIDDNRRSMQWRFIFGILNEMRDSFMQLKDDTRHFEKLWDALPENGKKAFRELDGYFMWEEKNGAPSLAKLLNSVRNRGVFHYVPKHFRQSLKELRQAFGDTDDGFIIEGTIKSGRIRFSFADTVRNAAAFGVDCDLTKINDVLGQQLAQVPEIVRLLNAFLQEAFAVMMRLRGYSLIEDSNGHWHAELPKGGS